jgi:hypothetical protein
MTVAVHPVVRSICALQERDRITRLLAAIDAVAEAKRRAKEPGLSEAAEFLRWDAVEEAEDRLLEMVEDPGLKVFLSAILSSLTDIAGEAA